MSQQRAELMFLKEGHVFLREGLKADVELKQVYFRSASGDRSSHEHLENQVISSCF